MGKPCVLKVGDVEKLTTEVDLDDLKILYQQYINDFSKFPIAADCTSINNLPQRRIINIILKENGVTYNEFCNKLGKFSNVRTESRDYDLFVEKYINTCEELGRTLLQKELTNNKYALPSAQWFVGNCSDESVKTYDDFVKWCCLESNSLKIDDDFIKEKLISLDESLDRPIKRTDITTDKVGFSMIVVNRLWGGLLKAQEDLGLKMSMRIVDRNQSFSDLKKDLSIILNSIKMKENRDTITLADISNTKYLEHPSRHSRYIRAFKKNNEDFYEFIASFGLKVKSDGNGNCYKFDDGEMTKSQLEYIFSRYLRDDLGMVYGIDYKRNVMYSKFSNTKRRIDCDYLVHFEGRDYYIEITGMIKPKFKDCWKETDFKSRGKNEYRDNLALKERLLIDGNRSYFIWFTDDIRNEVYRGVFKM